MDVIVARPLQALEVLQRGDAFVHLLELGCTQTFDAGLHGLDPALGEKLDLSLAKIALGLDEDIQVQVIRRKSSEQPVDIFQVDDVVDESEPSAVVARGKQVELFRHLFG